MQMNTIAGVAIAAAMALAGASVLFATSEGILAYSENEAMETRIAVIQEFGCESESPEVIEHVAVDGEYHTVSCWYEPERDRFVLAHEGSFHRPSTHHIPADRVRGS